MLTVELIYSLIYFICIYRSNSKEQIRVNIFNGKTKQMFVHLQPIYTYVCHCFTLKWSTMFSVNDNTFKICKDIVIHCAINTRNNIVILLYQHPWWCIGYTKVSKSGSETGHWFLNLVIIIFSHKTIMFYV